MIPPPIWYLRAARKIKKASEISREHTRERERERTRYLFKSVIKFCTRNAQSIIKKKRVGGSEILAL